MTGLVVRRPVGALLGGRTARSPFIGEAVPGQTPDIGLALVRLASADADAAIIRNVTSGGDTTYKGSEIEAGQVQADLAGDSGVVKNWLNQFGAESLTNAQATRQPDYDHSGADNGLPSVKAASAAFDNLDDTTVLTYTDLTLFIVTKMTAFPAAGRIFKLHSATAADNLTILNGGANTVRVQRIAGVNNLDFSVTDAVLASNALIQFRMGSGSADLSINNGVATATDTYDELSTISPSHLSFNAEQNDTSPMDQECQLVLGYMAKLTDAQAALQCAAINAKYGIY